MVETPNIWLVAKPYGYNQNFILSGVTNVPAPVVYMYKS